MKAAPSRRDRLRSMLADLKMPGSLEALDSILQGVDGGALTAAEAIESVLSAQIDLRNNRRLQAAMRSSRLPAVKLLEHFDFSFQPSIRRDQMESLHELGFVERKESDGNTKPVGKRLQPRACALPRRPRGDVPHHPRPITAQRPSVGDEARQWPDRGDADRNCLCAAARASIAIRKDREDEQQRQPPRRASNCEQDQVASFPADRQRNRHANRW